MSEEEMNTLQTGVKVGGTQEDSVPLHLTASPLTN